MSEPARGFNGRMPTGVRRPVGKPSQTRGPDRMRADRPYARAPQVRFPRVLPPDDDDQEMT